MGAEEDAIGMERDEVSRHDSVPLESAVLPAASPSIASESVDLDEPEPLTSLSHPELLKRLASMGKTFSQYIEELHNDPMRAHGELPPRLADLEPTRPYRAPEAVIYPRSSDDTADQDRAPSLVSYQTPDSPPSTVAPAGPTHQETRTERPARARMPPPPRESSQKRVIGIRRTGSMIERDRGIHLGRFEAMQRRINRAQCLKSTYLLSFVVSDGEMNEDARSLAAPVGKPPPALHSSLRFVCLP